jgi:hypothetical protein
MFFSRGAKQRELVLRVLRMDVPPETHRAPQVIRNLSQGSVKRQVLLAIEDLGTVGLGGMNLEGHGPSSPSVKVGETAKNGVSCGSLAQTLHLAMRAIRASARS